MISKKITFFGLLFIGCWIKLSAQIIYGSTFSQIYSADLTDCTVTPIVACPPLNDMCISPSGLFYGIQSTTIVSINSTNGAVTPIVAVPTTGGVISSLEWGNDGFLYAMSSKIWQINPISGALVDMGSLPAGWNSVGDLVILNGVCYGSINSGGTGYLVIVNLASPGASTILSNLPTTGLVAGASVTNPTCPRLFWVKNASNAVVYYFDLNSQTWGIQCGTFPTFFGGADTQNDYYFPISCGCTTDAGNVTASTTTICGIANPAIVPFTGGQVLDSDDILRYIIFTNLNSPATSILAQSTSPNIPFNPNTMVVGQTYYLATLAGNNLNGAVNLADPCKDFSNNFAQVIWRNLPAVTFSIANSSLCEGDCKTINAVFTGAAAFNLVYQIPFSAPETVVFPTNTGSFEVCPPTGTPVGNFTVSTISVQDAFCICE